MYYIDSVYVEHFNDYSDIYNIALLMIEYGKYNLSNTHLKGSQ